MSQCLPLPNRKKRGRHQNKTATDPSITPLSLSNKTPIASLETMDAMEYLAAVSREAKSLPDVFLPPPERRSNAPPKKENSAFSSFEGTHASIDALLSNASSVPRCSSPSLLPRESSEWVDGILSDFSTLRLHLERCLAGGIGGKNGLRSVTVPPMKDHYAWHEFCLGREEAEGNVGGYFDDDPEEENAMINQEEEEEEEEAEWQINLPKNGHPPTIKILLQLDQVLTRRVLTHHLFFLQEDWEVTENRMAWIYALLARLEKPLHRDDQANLRDLLKECCKRRNRIREKGGAVSTPRVLPALNTVIAIVGIYFEQGGKEVMECNLEV